MAPTPAESLGRVPGRAGSAACQPQALRLSVRLSDSVSAGPGARPQAQPQQTVQTSMPSTGSSAARYETSSLSAWAYGPVAVWTSSERRLKLLKGSNLPAARSAVATACMARRLASGGASFVALGALGLLPPVTQAALASPAASAEQDTADWNAGKGRPPRPAEGGSDTSRLNWRIGEVRTSSERGQPAILKAGPGSPLEALAGPQPGGAARG